MADLNISKNIAILQQELSTLRAENSSLRKLIAASGNTDKEFFALRDLIALMPGNIFWKDKEGKLLGCNNHLAKILSLTSPEEIIGKKTIDLIGPELAEQIDIIDKEIMASTQSTSIEEVGFNEKHEPAVYLSYKIPLRNKSGEVIGLLGTSLDITEQKRIEQELHKALQKIEASDRAKSQFLAVINHELRTPLTGILGLINFLKKDDLQALERMNIVTDLEHCAQYLLTLVNDVLDLTRLEAGKRTANIHTFDPKALVRDVANILAPLAKNKNIKLETLIEPDKSILISTDSRFLHHILINIASNAIKFTEEGSVVIKMHLQQLDAQLASLELIIADTGPGIPEDKLEIIFEPFHQLENVYLRQSSQSGTGLGLAIAKNLAKLINLNIEVKSTLGQGTTFILKGNFSIPQTANEINEQSLLQSESQPKQKLIAPEQKINVLLVEDDKIVQHVHKQMLLELGCNVSVAVTGQEALLHYSSQDILFVDIGLPDITGFDLIKIIRKQISNEQLPIIALTGYTSEVEKVAALNAGANEMKAKPISQADLKDILLRYFAGEV